MDIGLRLLILVALLACNAFFVAAEFALVTARKTRIESLAAEGHKAAIAVRRAMDDPKRFISACQMGVTMASLGLGWAGEGTIAEWLEGALDGLVPAGVLGITVHTMAIPVAFATVAFLTISLGELVPKMIALERAESVVLVAVRPVTVVGIVFRPFIAAFYSFTDIVLRALGFRWAAEHHQAYSLEDLKALLRSSVGTALPGEEPSALAERALDLGTLVTRQIMVPRTEMIAVPAKADIDLLLDVMRKHQHSRYPVFDESPDNVIGVIATKQLAAELPELNGRRRLAPEGKSQSAPLMAGDPDNGHTDVFNLRDYMSAPLFVPESMPAYRLLNRMKQHRSHLAIVVDEYGATAGIVSLRDLLDRIAGEVRDETDQEPPTIERLADGSVMVDGLALLGDVEAELNIELGEDYDTLGGLVFGKLGRRPRVGDAVEAAGCRFIVEELDGLRIARVRVEAPEGSREGGEETP
ncbi:MAG TPA: hemolysin family protein [Chloroflexota bacterium]